MKFRLLLPLLLIAGLGGSSLGQARIHDDIKEGLLPAPNDFVGCGLSLRYIDDVLDRAYKSESSLIAIVRMRLSSRGVSMARRRMDNLERYIRFRGFTNFNLAVGTREKGNDGIEFYVRGQHIYSLPIRPRDEFNLSICVAPKLSPPKSDISSRISEW